MIYIPKQVSGFPVSNRGVHGTTTDYHKGWLGDDAPWGGRDHWLGQLKDMHMSWLILLDSGGSVLEQFGPKGLTVVEHCLESGVQPIVRYHTTKLPYGFQDEHVVRELVRIYKHYDCVPFYLLWNEWANYREWRKDTVPSNWYEQVNPLWNDAAWKVLNAGAYPGYPDLPDYNFESGQNPFADTDRRVWETRKAWIGLHCYNVNRPWFYPSDPASQLGKPMTEEEWRLALDDFWGEPAWMQPNLEEMNTARREEVERRQSLGIPPPTFFDDYVCWWSWRRTMYYAEQTLGFLPPSAVTEGGDTPNARPAKERRYPPSTPKKVAETTLALYNEDSPHFCVAPWIWASQDQDGVPATWETDAWNGWGFSDKYGRVKPVVYYLMANPPQENVQRKLSEAIARLLMAQTTTAAAQVRLARAVEALRW